MKTSEKNTKNTTLKDGTQHTKKQDAEELQTEGPLSEKDEVKQAERNTQKQQNKGR